MSRKHLDDILSSDAEINETDSSLDNLNTDDFRIDIPENGKEHEIDEEGWLLSSGKPSESIDMLPMSSESSSSDLLYGIKDGFEKYSQDEGAEDYNDVPDIVTPPRERKRVRFNPGEKDDDNDDYADINPWDFKRQIRKLYREQLPDTYRIKNWRRPSKDLVGNFVELLENNVELASNNVFEKYSREIDRVLPDNEEQERLKDRLENQLFDVIYNIKKRLKRTKFPSKIWAENMNMEYVYAKGEAIKKRYENELNRAEAIERQVIREEEYLKSLQEDDQSRITEHKENLKKELTELSQNLHPSLSTALSNTFGLIKDSEMSHEKYKQDEITFNLKLKTDFTKPLLPSSDKSVKELLPELTEYDALINHIMDKLSNLINIPDSWN